LHCCAQPHMHSYSIGSVCLLAGRRRMWSATGSCGRFTWRARACQSPSRRLRRPPFRARTTSLSLMGLSAEVLEQAAQPAAGVGRAGRHKSITSQVLSVCVACLTGTVLAPACNMPPPPYRNAQWSHARLNKHGQPVCIAITAFVSVTEQPALYRAAVWSVQHVAR